MLNLSGYMLLSIKERSMQVQIPHTLHATFKVSKLHVLNIKGELSCQPQSPKNFTTLYIPSCEAMKRNMQVQIPHILHATFKVARLE